MEALPQWLRHLLEQVWVGLLWLTPLVAAAAMVFAHRAWTAASRTNATVESMWILLKAIRYKQEHPAGPEAPQTDKPSRPGQPDQPQ